MLRCSTSGLLAACLLGSACSAAAPEEVTTAHSLSSSLAPTLSLSFLSRYVAGTGFDVGAAEIVAHDSVTQHLFITNVFGTLDIVDINDPLAPTLIRQVDLTPYGASANSVAVKNGIVAVAVEAAVKQEPGKAVFFDADGNYLGQTTVGALPDMVTWSPNGRYVLVANEGEPSSDYSADPEGSITIIDTFNGVPSIRDIDVRTVSFSALDPASLDASVRMFGPNANPAQNFEPEYISISSDSKRAFVTLQENNAVAVIDIKSGSLVSVLGLGFKDHTLAGNGLDPSDRDGAIKIGNWPVRGMYLPDAIATLRKGNQTYFITANEGDSRDYAGYAEETRVGSVTLDPTAFPNASALKASAALGRLKITKSKGDTDGDGDYDQLYAFGARSFSIFKDDGTIVYDSGDQLEQITAAALPTAFNSTHDASNSFDTRSDDKGPEPEALTVSKVRGRDLAFVGMERIGGIAIFDVTDPAAPSFVQYLNSRDFTADVTTGLAGDLGPEGLLVIPAKESPTRNTLVVAAHEVSGTTALYELK